MDSPVLHIPTDGEYKSDSGLSDKYTVKIPIVSDVSRSSYEGYMTEHDDYATLGGRTPASSNAGMFVDPRTQSMSSGGFPIQKDNVSVTSVVTTNSHPIIGGGATVFTDMTDTMLKVLGRHMAINTRACMILKILWLKMPCAIEPSRHSITGYRQDTNPDWFLLVTGNPRISEVYCEYSNSLSLDNNPLVLVELK